MRMDIVLGMCFGDEGKGLFVDYLCANRLNPLVYRFSGGHQSGHTVKTKNVSHVFSNFGSGTLRNVPTIWTDFCTVEPFGLLKELKILLEKGFYPKIHISKQCPVTTPYDIYSNKKKELINQHGSCLVGFGETIEREENNIHLQILDLFYPSILKRKMQDIQNYYNISLLEDVIKEFYDICNYLINQKDNIELLSNSKDILYNKENLIFEGSQGLLLDQNKGFFPNVTRANTGLDNIELLIKNIDYHIYLVTRAYQTRHGNGFMTNEHIPHNIKENPLETNVLNKGQGKFRKSLLDVSLLEYALETHYNIIREKCSLVITCLDHVENEYRFTYKEQIINCINEVEFVNKIADILKIKRVYISKSDISDNIIKFRG